jgi:2,5-dioxopentanoate dehydrogenase
MTFQPHGKHLIAGSWVGSGSTFSSAPIDRAVFEFAIGTPDHVAKACEAAEEAFDQFGAATRAERAAFLNSVADEIEARATSITSIGTSETGLPAARLEGERGRTTGQLRLFATHILNGDYLDRRKDAALPDRKPMPRPELRMMQRPVGPVAIFGASNFPLAFSTAGGDTAAALAAGCPVVVKGHSAHPGTSEIVAEAMNAAIQKNGIHPGVFSLIQGGDRAVGEALVRHPFIKAVGFTGSLGGGRALFNLCAARPDPIPFFGELGSVNPMFLLPHALQARGKEIGAGWAQSLTMGAGQFCTKPGIAVVIESLGASQFTNAVQDALKLTSAQSMLTAGIAEAFRTGKDRIAGKAGVRGLASGNCDQRSAMPALFSVSGRDWLNDEQLKEEVFGPLGIIVKVENFTQMLAIARSLHGQLTCTLHLEGEDGEQGRALLPILERKAGRVLANGFPTGVEVCDSMVHGGPYPASTNFGATSVGTLSIRRFLRPVCYQNLPEALLPADLQGQ